MTIIQDRIQRLLDAAVASGCERGVQVAVYQNDRLVVDAWAGTTDATTSQPVDGDTLFPVFSVTKGIMTTVVHRLVERGLFDYDTPLADLWPAFSANGKSGITVRHVLTHTAGLQNMPCDVVVDDLGNWDAMCAALARATPVSEPGAFAVYHAVTFGWLAGEVARRATGRPVPDLIRDEICRPAGIDDIYCDLPTTEDARVAILEDASSPPPPVPSNAPATVPFWMCPLHDWMNRMESRRACIPASTGIMSARALARHYAALLPGGVDGVELLPPERVRMAMVPHFGREDQPGQTGRGLGYMLFSFDNAPDAPKTALGHAGFGGANGFADLAGGYALGFTRNLLFAPGQKTLDAVLAEVRHMNE